MKKGIASTVLLFAMLMLSRVGLAHTHDMAEFLMAQDTAPQIQQQQALMKFDSIAAATRAESEAAARAIAATEAAKAKGGTPGKFRDTQQPNGVPGHQPMPLFEGDTGSLISRGITKKGETPSGNGTARGTIVVRVCVNRDGKVTSAEVVPDGTNITDENLQAKAIISAKQYEFKSAEIEQQCGNLSFQFR